MDAPGDALAALRLLMEWGADEALADAPVDRRSTPDAVQPVPAHPVTAHPITARPITARPVAVPAPPRPAPRPPPAPTPPPGGATSPPSPAQARTLEELRAALLAFDGCGLRVTAKSLALADGNPQAGLVLVGEAPSDDDDRTGRPFSGPGGAQLDAVFASVGLDRTAMLLTMLVPWRTPGKRPPNPSEVTACLPFHLHHLRLLRPRRLVLFGGTVTRALGLGPEPIGRLRGTWRPVEVPGLGPVPALPLRPVESALKSAASKQELWHDLLMLKSTLVEEQQG